MARGEETSDVFFRGVLLYKSGALTACQKCRAELKFESRSGFKRLDLYPIHGNRRLPGSPSTTIPLTNALGVINGKQHTITRAKYTFQVITPKERYQLSTQTEEEKGAWLRHLDLILNHLPVDNRTHEFHVSISPTAHSDNLQLTGQYILKVTDTELHLFSASGTIHSKFWTPLGSIREAHHCFLPASAVPPQSRRGQSVGGGASRNPTTQHLLIITTESSSPVGEGGFAFFTYSAKDMAVTIMHRREMRLLSRSVAAPLSLTDGGETSHHQRPESPSSVPINPSSGQETDPTTPPPPEPEGEVRLRERGEQSSLRKCARRSRMIPMSHQQEKAKSQLRLQLGGETAEQNTPPLFTPDEPTHMPMSELAIQRRRFKQWKREREEADGKKSGTSPGILSPDSATRQQRWSRERRSTVSTPTPDRENKHISDLSSLDGGYVTIFRRHSSRDGVEEEEEEEEEEMSLGRLRGLVRQKSIQVLSPTEDVKESGIVGMRPRTNAISACDHSPPSQRSPERHTGGGEKAWQCDEDSCWLHPRAPPLSSTQKKSGSDPQLSTREKSDLISSASYLTILPSTPPAKKAPKKPKPTPRTRKPLDLPLPGNSPFLTMTPPTTTSPGRGCSNHAPHKSLTRGLDVRTLLSGQRSLSESNLFSGVSPCEADTPEDDYVDMSQYQRNWEQRELYVNYDCLLTEAECLAVRGGGMRRQVSSSCGDLRSAPDEPQPLYENAKCCAAMFQEVEEIYENGQHAMEHYMYGSNGEEEEEEEEDCLSSLKGRRGNVTAPCSYGDSGLGSTPSGSPLLTCQQRSFSLGDVRQPDKHPEEPKRPPKPCKWQFTCCMNVAKGQIGHAHKGYKNLPTIVN